MYGPEGAAERLVDWLTTRIPAHLATLTAQHDDGIALPPPVTVAAQERGPLALEDWPSVFVLPQRLVTLDVLDTERTGAEDYRATYTLDVLAWVRGDGYAHTDTLRKRYALAVRMALLERKQLTAVPGYGAPAPASAADVVVTPSSIREDYSDVLVDDASQTIAGVVTTVDVTVLERLPGAAPLGTVQTTPTPTLEPLPMPTTDGDTVTIPVHPALA